MIETSRGLAAGAEIAARVIQNVPEVDAFFCAGDVLAAGALFECRKRGWAVPGRIAIASFRRRRFAAACFAGRHDASPAALRYRRRSAQMLLSRIMDEARITSWQRCRPQIRNHSARKRIAERRSFQGPRRPCDQRQAAPLLCPSCYRSQVRERGFRRLLSGSEESRRVRGAAVSGKPRRPGRRCLQASAPENDGRCRRR